MSDTPIAPFIYCAHNERQILYSVLREPEGTCSSGARSVACGRRTDAST